MKSSGRLCRGELVQVLAGHDKREYFLVLSVQKPYVFLCDGKRRKVNHLKKKKEKHVISTGLICGWIDTEPERVNNTSVRRAIRDLLRKQETEFASGR
ncbi:KOW domain-containing RNA-binding protein [Ructibacterium gallinarum]|uniref:KOW domain-containing protein n=1 Tax=Ructibacterium gallinarum TaxID=2779355 RepID=A0A9D5LZZ1_9FIRM|nr:hypothetical protein [Ructibacterium gallinarum]MBE5038918.1 hypothetical protein [Ructibacterium gallinarum]